MRHAFHAVVALPFDPVKSLPLWAEPRDCGTFVGVHALMARERNLR